MATWVLYLQRPVGPATTANAGVYEAPVAQALSINDANILTDKPGLLGGTLTSLTDKTLFLKRWLRRYEDSALVNTANGVRALLSRDAGATFIAADRP